MKYALYLFLVFLSSCHWKEDPTPKYNWCEKREYIKTTKFLLFPSECSNHVWRWLETVKIRYCYDSTAFPGAGIYRYEDCIE